MMMSNIMKIVIIQVDIICLDTHILLLKICLETG